MKSKSHRNAWSKQYKNKNVFGRDLSNMYADRIKFEESSFIEANLSGSTFVNCHFDYVFFVRCNMKYTTFQNCTFKDVIFEENVGLSEYGVRSSNQIEGRFEFQPPKPKRPPVKRKKTATERFLDWLLPT